MQISSINEPKKNSFLTAETMKTDHDRALHFHQRSTAHFIFPPSTFFSQLHRFSPKGDFHSNKRQSFGRKQHWDVFFGRR